MNENNLQRTDIRNVSLSLYRERRRQLPTLPKNRDETHAAKQILNIVTKTSNVDSCREYYYSRILSIHNNNIFLFADHSREEWKLCSIGFCDFTS
jgi:hypothetical protein